ITFNNIDAAELLKADLRGYAAGSGGSLALTTSSSFQIGGAAQAPAGSVRLAETLYSERGFRSLDITTGGNIGVAYGATVSQLPRSFDLTDAAHIETGDVAPIVVLSSSQRARLAPTSLSLKSGNVTIGVGATVATDIGGTIAIKGQGSGAIKINGRLEA